VAAVATVAELHGEEAEVLLRLATAASILSSADSSDTDTVAADEGALPSSSGLSSSVSGASSPAASAPGSPRRRTRRPSATAAALSALTELRLLDADSLSLAIGILRQHQPLDSCDDGRSDSSGHADDAALGERLQDLLVLLRTRPGAAPTAARGAGDAQRLEHKQQGVARRAASAPRSLSSSPSPSVMASLDGFWAPPDEWADVRAALMGIGIDASLDEDDAADAASADGEEGVWDVEAGGIRTRRFVCVCVLVCMAGLV
jgi:hypothetical protein